jgi:hypothetical protein
VSYADGYYANGSCADGEGLVVVGLHDAEAFAHKSLEARAPDEVVGEVFAGEHGEGGRAGVGDHLGGFVDGEGAVLRDCLHDEVHHHLEAAEELGFFELGGGLGGGGGGGFMQSRLLFGTLAALVRGGPPLRLRLGSE